MKKTSPGYQSRFFRLRVLGGLVLVSVAVFLALLGFGVYPAFAQNPKQNQLGAVVASGQDLAKHGVAPPQKASGPIYSKIPKLTPEQVKARDKELQEVNSLPVPVALGTPSNAAPVNAPTKAILDQRRVVESKANLQPEAANDFTYRTVHDLTTNETSTLHSVIGEPSTANMGTTSFYTGNWYAARSTDSGQSFTYVSPFNTFSSVNNGFCCDQIVNYAANQDMMLWALLYSHDSVSGTVRIARAIGGAAVANNTWTYYDFNPQQMGFSANNWLDFPNMTVADNYLYITANVFDTVVGCPNQCRFNGSLIWRIRLSDLAAGGMVNFDYFPRTDVGALRCTEGAHTTMYWGALLGTSQLRIFRWDDAASNVFFDDVNISSFIWLNRDGLATSPDGTNWAARADSRITGSWVAGGVIGLMWPAKQGGSFAYPYTIVAQFNQSNRALITQNQIWNPQYAWLYPTASVNSVGNLAGFVTAGGGPIYPSANIFISDDVQNGFNPLALYSAAASNVGPSSNAWGDYQTVRPQKTNPNTWVGSTHYLDSGSNVIPRYLWFGRERDFPGAVPSSPTANLASNVTSNSFTANWGSVSGATGYRLDVSTSSSFTSYVSGYQDLDVGNVTSRSVSGLSANTTYYYQVRAYNTSGTSGNSNVVSVTTTAVAPAPNIAVEQPVGTNITTGGSKAYGTMVLGSPVNLIFTIKNTGTANLTGLTFTTDGVNATEFVVTTNPSAPVIPGGSTTFTLQFAPTTSGAKTAAIHIASNDPNKNPFNITLTGRALSFTEDTDGDGMNDASEFLMSALGFDWQVAQPNLVNTYYSNANGAGLFTMSQLQALKIGAPLIAKQWSGQFKLTIAVQKSTDLIHFNAFPMSAPQTTINGQGQLEFQFTVPDNAAFFRLESH
jgi:fibronectin type III domain protein